MRCLLLGLCALNLAGCQSEAEVTQWQDLEQVLGRFDPRATAHITSTTPLAEYVRLARARNPGLRAGAARWRAALERIPQARGLPDPHVRYGYFFESVETRTGPQRHRLGLSQTIPWPGKLAHRSGVAQFEAAAAQARFGVGEQALSFAVTETFARHYYLGREQAFVEETKALVERWEAVARARLRAGASAAHRDVIKAQVELGRLRDRAASLRDARAPMVRRVQALLDLPADAPVPTPRALPAPRLARSDAQLNAALLEHSPSLRVLERSVEARKAGVSLARQSYLPDVMLGVELIEVGSARASGVRGSGDDAYLGTVGINLPIWFGRYGASVSEARARLRAAELDRTDRGSQLRAELSGAVFAYRDGERQDALYGGTLIAKAEQSLQATAKAYQAGQGDFLDLLDAERMLLDFRLARVRARVARVIALARLEALVGQRVTEEVWR